MTQTTIVSSDPEGFGFELTRWSIFAILAYIPVYFHRMAPGVVSGFLMADFNISCTRLGALSAIYFAVYALMKIPSGVIADTLGTRASIITGNLVADTGSILFGLATAAYGLSWIMLMYLPWVPGITGFTLFAFMGFLASGFITMTLFPILVLAAAFRVRELQTPC